MLRFDAQKVDSLLEDMRVNSIFRVQKRLAMIVSFNVINNVSSA